MTFLCVVTRLVGVSFLSRGIAKPFIRVSVGNKLRAAALARSRGIARVTSAFFGTTLIIASMLLAARNAGLL